MGIQANNGFNPANLNILERPKRVNIKAEDQMTKNIDRL